MRQRQAKIGNPKRITILLGAVMACGIATLLQHSLAAEFSEQSASGTRVSQPYSLSPQPNDRTGNQGDNRTLPQDARFRQQPSFSAPKFDTLGNADTDGVGLVNSQTELRQGAHAIPTIVNDGTPRSRIKLIRPASHEESAGNSAAGQTDENSSIRLLTFEPQAPSAQKPTGRTTSLVVEASPLQPVEPAAKKADASAQPAPEPTTNSESRFTDLYQQFSPSPRATAHTPSEETKPAKTSVSRFADLYKTNSFSSRTSEDTPSAESRPTTSANLLDLPPPPTPNEIDSAISKEQGTTRPANGQPTTVPAATEADSESADSVFAPPKIVLSPTQMKVLDKPNTEPKAAGITGDPDTPAPAQQTRDTPAAPAQGTQGTVKLAAEAEPADKTESSEPQPHVVHPAALAAGAADNPSSNLVQESAPAGEADAQRNSAVFHPTNPGPGLASADRTDARQATATFRDRAAQHNLAAIDQLHKRGLVPFEPIAQLQPGAVRDPFLDDPNEPDPHAPTPFEILGPTGEMNVTVRRNKILRCKDNLTRVAVVDDKIVEFVQFSPREVSIIGREVGATHVTFWFADETQRPITYLVRVTPDPELQNETEHEYQILEEVLAELFPDSKVYLIPVADKLIVRGQAKDAEEAAQILGILRGEETEFGSGRRGRLIGGNAAAPIPGGRARTVRSVVNMLQIPGVHQIALRVKIAELNRSAARNSGLNLDAKIRFNGGRDGQLLLNTLLNSSTTASVFGTFTDFDIDLGLNYLKTQGVIRVLSEPTLVTMNGKSANFHAGGQFAVPTAVGVGGIGAVATEFKLFGVSLTFLPTILDKDRIRLNISPSFSQVDAGLSVGGTPGITDRSVTTTVEMREGQTLAIAGLLEDTMKSATAVDLPFLPRVFGKRDVSREETELIILVTPELIHPMEPEAVPPLPGFDVTEPTDHQFFLGGRIEGLPTHEHRSTVWPRLKHRYQRGGSEMISGPFGHGQ